MDPDEGSPFCLEQNGGARVAGGPKGRTHGCASQILPPLPNLWNLGLSQFSLGFHISPSFHKLLEIIKKTGMLRSCLREQVQNMIDNLVSKIVVTFGRPAFRITTLIAVHIVLYQVFKFEQESLCAGNR